MVADLLESKPRDVLMPRERVQISEYIFKVEYFYRSLRLNVLVEVRLMLSLAISEAEPSVSLAFDSYRLDKVEMIFSSQRFFKKMNEQI